MLVNVTRTRGRLRFSRRAALALVLVVSALGLGIQPTATAAGPQVTMVRVVRAIEDAEIRYELREAGGVFVYNDQDHWGVITMYNDPRIGLVLSSYAVIGFEDDADRAVLLQRANRWNLDRRFYRSFLYNFDDGSQGLIFERIQAVNLGMTDSQIDIAVARFIGSIAPAWSYAAGVYE